MEQNKDQSGAAVVDVDAMTTTERDGYEAGIANKPDPNPYRDGSKFRSEWQSGFDTGRAECLSWDVAAVRGEAVAGYPELYRAVVACGHKIDEETVTLYRDPKLEGNALSQLGDRLDTAAAKVSARAADAPSEPSEAMERIFESWDGCDYDGIDIGAALRADFKTFVFGKSRAADALDSQPLIRPQPNHPGRWLRGDDGISYPSEQAASSQPTDGGVRNGSDLKAVHDFLMGESPLEGVQFGEKHPTKAGAHWWRLNLRAALAKG